MLPNGLKSLCIVCEYHLPVSNSFLYPSNNSLTRLFAGRCELQFAVYLWDFTGEGRVRTIIHNIKYKNKQTGGVLIGKRIGNYLKEKGLFNKIDIILPVPIHKKKLMERGYNQSALLAKGINSISAIQFSDEILIRKAYKHTQTKKSKYKRWENMQDVFACVSSKQIANKNILLVDDVVTTGATTEACIAKLYQNGAQSVSIAAAAFTAL